MLLYKAIAKRTDLQVEVHLGRATKGKMNIFRLMQAEGAALCALFDDCGEFEFRWNTGLKTWQFFSESGNCVGFIEVVLDVDANKKKSEAYYHECLAAFNASKP